MTPRVCPRCGGPLHATPDGWPPVCSACSSAPGSDVDTKTSSENGPPAAAQDYRGRSFGGYEIIKEVSRGAMGVVYQARQPLLGRVVALKVLIAGDMASEVQVARFQREAQAAARLRHPAIVPIHDVGVFEGKNFYTMDFIEGQPLSKLIKAGAISTRRALELAADVAEALDYAHGQGVVHRDIKPSNIMVDAEGKVHIMDFGLAKQLDSDTRFTRTGTTIGTPSYMPPEQAGGDSRRVDHRADIYSLGAVLYEMLTGRPPFSGETMMNTLMQVLNDEPVPPKRLNPRIHRDIQTIVLAAMEKRPERRYRTMGALAADVRHFIAGESITARPAGLAYRSWRWLKKYRTAVFAMAAVLIIGLTAYTIVQQERVRLGGIADRAHDEAEDAKKASQEAAKKLKEELEPTRKIVFTDDFADPAFRKRWKVEGGQWRAADGGLHVAARSLAAIHTLADEPLKPFSGNVTIVVDFRLPPPTGRSPRRGGGVVGCYLGEDWRHSYRVALGGRGESRLVVMNPREEVAGIDVPPLEPDVPYRFVVARTPIGLHVTIESVGRDVRQELSYNDLALPSVLGNEFAAGLFAERTRLVVERVQVEQEFSPLKMSALQIAEGLFRDGNFELSRKRYENTLQGYEGRYEGLAARFGMALCDLAQGDSPAAIEHLRRVERDAAGVRNENLRRLLTRTRLHRFFASANRNNFTDAVDALGRLAASQEHVDGAWVWHFPKRVANLINVRAYDEALGLLGANVFGPRRETLYGATAALRAPRVQATLATHVRELAEAFCDDDRSGKVKDVYTAYPTPMLADAFARAAEDTLRRDERDEALALLAFCTTHKMASPRLTQAAVNLANNLCDAELHTRLADLHAAFPAPQLAPAFTRAIAETADAGHLDDSLALLKMTVKNFAADAKTLLGPDGPAFRLGKALIARGELLKPIELHKALGQPPADAALLALFVEAAQKAIDTKRPDEARTLLGYSRDNFGVLHAALAAVATRLVTQSATEGDFKQVAAAHDAYPNEALAPSLVKAMTAAVAARRLPEALTIFATYAASRYPLPSEALRALADGVAAGDPAREDARALLAQYRRVQTLYDKPVVETQMTLALGTAYVKADRLLPGLAQYEAAGGFEGLLRAGCVAAELGQAERAIALWQDLAALAEGDDHWTPIGAFLLGNAGTADLQRAAAAARFSPAAIAYLRGLRLWFTGASGADKEFARAARAADPEWFIPLARRDRTPPPDDEEPVPPERP